MSGFFDLPIPSPAKKKRSDELSQIIKTEILQNHGSISFARYMHLALYHTQLGFYHCEDYAEHFLTAPLISRFFGKCLAEEINGIFSQLSKSSILEIGAGNGQLACDLLMHLSHTKNLPQDYLIYEVSPYLRAKQHKILAQKYPEIASKIKWIDKLPENFVGIIIANEVLDALPIQRFRIDNNNKVSERCVAWENDGFVWHDEKPSSELFAQTCSILSTKYSLASGYESEVNMNLKSFIRKVATTLKKGAILFFDYGYGQAEYYHPERNRGTLTCFYKHRKNDEPFIYPGLQDITAHVDFTEVAEFAADANCEMAGFTTQAGFLLGCGLLDLAHEKEKKLSASDQFTLHQGIKILTMPSEMGECVKVMALTKGISPQLRGFSLQDRRRDL